MALLRLRIETTYEVDPKDMEVLYGTGDSHLVAEHEARSFQEDPSFVAEFITEHAEHTETRVEVIHE